MRRSALLFALAVPLLASAALAAAGARKPSPKRGLAAGRPVGKMSPAEAKRAAAMLDDAYQTILFTVHDWYPTRTGQPLVAAHTVRELQEIMVKKGWPSSRFLAVSGPVMNPDHLPADAFEKQAAAAIRGGRDRFEQITKDRLRVATVVPLGGGCNNCHWTASKTPSRAAIAWCIPLTASRPAKR